MKSRLLHALALLSVVLVHGVAHAALSTYLALDGLSGASSPPGLSDVIALDSLTIGGGSLAATKLVDSTSPQLANALVTATPYATASLAFYDALATDVQPDAQLVLHTVLASSIQSVMIGPNLGETVTFSFLSPSLSLFLELPGVNGASSAPGHPDVIALDSLSLSAGGFSVHKAVDSTSPALATALLSATPYASASLLFYSSINSQTQPDFALVFQNALVSSIATDSSGDQPSQDVAFVAAGVTVQTPEPEPAALLAAAVLAGAARLRRTRARR